MFASRRVNGHVKGQGDPNSGYRPGAKGQQVKPWAMADGRGTLSRIFVGSSEAVVFLLGSIPLS